MKRKTLLRGVLIALLICLLLCVLGAAVILPLIDKAAVECRH